MDFDSLTLEEQAANAFLRDRFLSYMTSLCGIKKDVKIKMHENTVVSGMIKAVDLNFENIIVENLNTPLPDSLKMAVLRANDILTISYK